jgi:hypothetical protein
MEKEKEEKSKTEKEAALETSKTCGSVSVQRQAADATTMEHTAGSIVVDRDVRAATFLDVATLRCLFVSQWQEEGVFWALQFFYYRLVALRITSRYHACNCVKFKRVIYIFILKYASSCLNERDMRI